MFNNVFNNIPPHRNKFEPITFEDCLGKCKYFIVQKYEIDSEKKLYTDEKSFHCLTCVKGNGFIEDMEIRKGDSFFVPANYGEYVVKGKIQILLTMIQ